MNFTQLWLPTPGDARGDRGVGAGDDRAAGPAAELFGRGDRSAVDAEAGVWSTLTPDRRHARFDHGAAWSGVAGSGARQGQRSYHTTFSRRSVNLGVAPALKKASGPVHVVIDSTGLKVFGSGEWLHEKHGGEPRRTWRKLHLAIDPASGEILASELTITDEGDASLVGPLLEQIYCPISAVFADGAYDGEPIYHSVTGHTPDAAVIIPPRSTAVPSAMADTNPTQRDRHIQLVGERGRLGWQRLVGYGRRSLEEVAMFRYKKVIGKTEAKVACKVINIMTSLGMPVSRRGV